MGRPDLRSLDAHWDHEPGRTKLCPTWDKVWYWLWLRFMESPDIQRFDAPLDHEPARGYPGRFGRREILGGDWRTTNAPGLCGPKAGETPARHGFRFMVSDAFNRDN